MRRQSVSSTSVASVGYDDAMRTLEIEFKTGRVYQYRGVEAEIFHQLMNAPSKGRFLNAYIRNSYPFSRIELKWPPREREAEAPCHVRNTQPKRPRPPRGRPR